MHLFKVNNVFLGTIKRLDAQALEHYQINFQLFAYLGSSISAKALVSVTRVNFCQILTIASVSNSQ